MKNIEKKIILSSEEQLLSIVNLARIDSKSREMIEKLSDNIQWDIFLDLMDVNAVSVLTLKNIYSLKRKIPESSQLQSLREKTESIKKRAARRLEHARLLLGRLYAAGIEVILLKGGALGDLIYQDPCYKKMNDVDILIRFEQVKEAISIFQELGFRSVGALFGQEEISEKMHHCPPYVSQDLTCVIGLHWGLHSSLAPWHSDIRDVWKRKVPVNALGSHAFRMSWEDNLLHLCFHLPFFKIGLRELADVSNLIRFCDPKIDWKEVVQRAKEWGVEDPVFRVLSLARAFIPFEVPNEIIDSCRTKASAFSINDTERRLSQEGLLFRSRSVQIGRIEKAFSILQLSQVYSEKVQAWAATWLFTFWPNKVELKRIGAFRQDLAGFHLVYARFVVPVKIWRALARDYGHVPLILITGINIWKVVLATFKRPWEKPENRLSLADHPARKLLEVLE
jgi:hypothetical protein